VEQDTEVAYLKRRELVKLLVEKITVDRDEDGRVKVVITYRFGPVEAPPEADSLVGVQDFDTCGRGNLRGNTVSVCSGCRSSRPRSVWGIPALLPRTR
jgi:hypothetical protein